MSNTKNQKRSEQSIWKNFEFSGNSKTIHAPIPIRKSNLISQHLIDKINTIGIEFVQTPITDEEIQNSLAHLPLNKLVQYLQMSSTLSGLESIKPQTYVPEDAAIKNLSTNSEFNFDGEGHCHSHKNNMHEDNTIPPKVKGKKPVRKQTSFAQTDIKSENLSIDEQIACNNFQLTHYGQSGSLMESIDGNLQAKKKYEEVIIPENNEALSYSSGLTTNQENLSKNETSHPTAKMVGLLTAKERQIKVQRYLDKKKKRKGENNVRYGCRQDLAHKRFRFQGRFIKSEDIHKLKGNYIVDFNGKRLLKPIFKIEKVSKSCPKTTPTH